MLFAAEASVRTDYHAGTTWAPVGQTPVVTASAVRQAVKMVSAIGQRGELSFQVHEGSMNAERFVEFLKSLVHDFDTPVFLVVDGSSVHKARIVTVPGSGVLPSGEAFGRHDLLEERLIAEDRWVDAEVSVARVRRRRQLPSSGAKVYRLGPHQVIALAPSGTRDMYRPAGGVHGPLKIVQRHPGRTRRGRGATGPRSWPYEQSRPRHRRASGQVR